MRNLRDFPEDATHENGRYYVVCQRCGEQFIGHKRRVICKVCEQWLYRPEPAGSSLSGKDRT